MTRRDLLRISLYSGVYAAAGVGLGVLVRDLLPGTTGSIAWAQGGFTWVPDTCEPGGGRDRGCRLEYRQGDPPVFVRALRVCRFHVGVPAGQLEAVIKAENQSKNRIEGRLLQNPALTVPDGRGGVRFADGVRYTWGFTGQGATRELRVSVQGARTLSLLDKDALRTFTQALPLGRIVVE